MPNPGPQALHDYMRRLRAAERETLPPETPEEPEELSWMGGRQRRPRPCDPPPVELVERPSLEDTRAMMSEAIKEYLALPDPRYVLLVRAAPGVGKTTAAVRAAEEMAERGATVMYAGPRHAFFEDVARIASRPRDWQEWWPRQAAEEGKVETCPHAVEITTWLQRGWRGIKFCEGVCGWPYVKDRCVYHAQARDPRRLVYAMHEHVVMGHPREFGVVFGDESPIGKFDHRWRIPARWVRPTGMDPINEFTLLVDDLRTLTEKVDGRVDGEELLGILGGAERVAEACDAFAMSVGDRFMDPEIHRPDQAAQTDYCHLPQLCALLRREAGLALDGREYPHRVQTWDGQLVLYLRRAVNTRMPAHVVWLDATGEPEIYRACLGRPVRVVEARPALRGRVFQVWGRQYGKSATVGSEDRDPHPSYVAQIEDTLRRIIEEHGYEKPGVITFKELEGKSELIRGMVHGHFYAARGTNLFEGCDAVLVVGTPQPPVTSMKEAAKMVWFERDEPFRAEWVTGPERFSYLAPDGLGREHETSGFWNDRALQALLWSLREAEVEQAAHRARPVHRDADVWLLTNLPTPNLPLSGLYSLRDVFDAPEGVDVFRWQDVVTFAERMVDDHEAVTTIDFVELLPCSRHTATKYIKLLIEHLGWEPGSARPRGDRGGRPPLSASYRSKCTTL